MLNFYRLKKEVLKLAGVASAVAAAASGHLFDFVKHDPFILNCSTIFTLCLRVRLLIKIRGRRFLFLSRNL